MGGAFSLSPVGWCCFPSPHLRVGPLGPLLLLVVLPSSPSFGWGWFPENEKNTGLKGAGEGGEEEGGRDAPLPERGRGRAAPPNRREVSISICHSVFTCSWFSAVQDCVTNLLRSDHKRNLSRYSTSDSLASIPANKGFTCPCSVTGQEFAENRVFRFPA